MERMRWYTSEEEMRMINPDITFVAVVDHKSEWTEEVATFDEAVQLLRDLIESDGHHIFMKVDRWRRNSGSMASIHSNVVWCDTETGKTCSKTIRVKGIDYQKIASYQTRYLAYLKGKYPDKYRYW